jgi:hypothetical protein
MDDQNNETNFALLYEREISRRKKNASARRQMKLTQRAHPQLLVLNETELSGSAEEPKFSGKFLEMEVSRCVLVLNQNQIKSDI